MKFKVGDKVIRKEGYSQAGMIGVIVGLEVDLESPTAYVDIGTASPRGWFLSRIELYNGLDYETDE